MTFLREKFKFCTLLTIFHIFTHVHVQAKQRADQLLLEVSVLSSWVTETELAVQALAKKTKKQSSIASKLIATKEVRILKIIFFVVYYLDFKNLSSELQCTIRL